MTGAHRTRSVHAAIDINDRCAGVTVEPIAEVEYTVARDEQARKVTAVTFSEHSS